MLDGGPRAPKATLLAEAFHVLLTTGSAAPVARLASALAVHPEAVVDVLAGLERAGRVRRDASGAVLGSLGLSIVPTRHEVLIEGKQRWTWCAYDALAILAALEANGRVRSSSPLTGASIEVVVQAGQPRTTETVVFIADVSRGCGIEDWCPLVNFFESDVAALAWAARGGVGGRVLRVEEAASKGAAEWRPRIAARASAGEAEVCDDGSQLADGGCR
jgi:alkylmercury lyase